MEDRNDHQISTRFSRLAALHLPRAQRLSRGLQFGRTREIIKFIGRLNCARQRCNPNARPMIPSHPCCWDNVEVRFGSECEYLAASVTSPLVLKQPT
jgi:hypothetical protein